jgi:hypothetical protein
MHSQPSIAGCSYCVQVCIIARYVCSSRRDSLGFSAQGLTCHVIKGGGGHVAPPWGVTHNCNQSNCIKQYWCDLRGAFLDVRLSDLQPHALHESRAVLLVLQQQRVRATPCPPSAFSNAFCFACMHPAAHGKGWQTFRMLTQSRVIIQPVDSPQKRLHQDRPPIAQSLSLSGRDHHAGVDRTAEWAPATPFIYIVLPLNSDMPW